MISWNGDSKLIQLNLMVVCFMAEIEVEKFPVICIANAMAVGFVFSAAEAVSVSVCGSDLIEAEEIILKEINFCLN